MKIRSIRNLLPRLALGGTVAAWMGSLGAWGAAFEPVDDFGSNPGQLRMYKYVPKESQEPRPMVVVLHGCTQDHSYARDAGWDKLAERWNFILLVPEQQDSNNKTKAFTWWEFKSGWLSSPRTKKEVKSIQQMMDKMKTDYKIDATKVYITGLSAGGAMTAVMMACRPDEFAGAGVCSGLPHRSAATLVDAFVAMYVGTDLSPHQWGQRVRDEARFRGSYPKVSIWHGSADTTVVPLNAKELMEQWTDVHGIDQVADEHKDIQLASGKVSHDVYKDNQGNALVETYLISGMSHATAIDPGSKEDQGGVPSQYVKDENIFSSYHMARFWGLIPTSTSTSGAAPEPIVTVEKKVEAVLRLLKGDDAATVASELGASPTVTAETLGRWKQKFIAGGTAALTQ